jgi:hypothetical protein
LVRNTLNSRDPYFINVVLKELSKRLVWKSKLGRV